MQREHGVSNRQTIAMASLQRRFHVRCGSVDASEIPQAVWFPRRVEVSCEAFWLLEASSAPRRCTMYIRRVAVGAGTGSLVP